MTPTNIFEIRRLAASNNHIRFTIPDGISAIIIKNVGLASVRMNISGKSRGQYITILSQEQLPELKVIPGIEFEFLSTLAQNELEILMWG